jgi:hypothetical protein
MRDTDVVNRYGPNVYEYIRQSPFRSHLVSVEVQYEKHLRIC